MKYKIILKYTYIRINIAYNNNDLNIILFLAILLI